MLKHFPAFSPLSILNNPLYFASHSNFKLLLHAFAHYCYWAYCTHFAHLLL